MILRWLPWKYLIGRAARAYGIIDPIQVLARLRGFSQPSEVQEPIELLRAGVLFQARGLVNARVIQYNMDWVWPYWVSRQFGPEDPSFVPRAFSFGHINLTQRSWTAVGHPELSAYPIIDPRGLVTPLYDGWSLDCWIVDPIGRAILPSAQPQAAQHVHYRPDMAIQTVVEKDNGALLSEATIVGAHKTPFLKVSFNGRMPGGGWLVVSLRPYNPEGISFIEDIAYDESQLAWRVNGKDLVLMDQQPDRVALSDFRRGDVFHHIVTGPEATAAEVHCTHGLATAAAAFKIADRDERTVTLHIPLMAKPAGKKTGDKPAAHTLSGDRRLTATQATLPDPHYQFLFDNAVHTLMMLSAEEIYPGPYTYKRFWFRDACLMMHPMLCIGELERARRHLDQFVLRQKSNGYFRSQEGEWDSNGQVLWIMGRYRELSGSVLPTRWIGPILRGARWILAKCTPRNSGSAHAGLLPAGFSAEHLGPNDYYYWDDFWAVAGLGAAARLLSEMVSPDLGRSLQSAANRLEKDIWRSVESAPAHQRRGGIPASPYRRMDAGAIGSMVADYPLQLTPVGDKGILATLTHLLARHMVNGGFFQDMIHSGINAYLTLALAQTLLRHDDPRYADLMEAVAGMASPTGNWPEAVHPFSGGGCMGDAQHGWAAAEWIMMIRNLFVREEAGRLVIGSGLLPRWLRSLPEGRLHFGPTPTAYGVITVTVTGTGDTIEVHTDGRWHDRPAPVDVRLPGYPPMENVDLSKPVIFPVIK